MGAATEPGPGGRSGWAWFWTAVFGVVLAAATMLVIMALQLQSTGVGRVALGWPLPALYHITDFQVEGDVILHTQSRLEFDAAGLAGDLLVLAVAYVLLVVILRLAWNLRRPRSRPARD